MKTTTYLATLILSTRDNATGDLRVKLERLLAELGAQPGLFEGKPPEEIADALATALLKSDGRKRATTAITEGARLARDDYERAAGVLYSLAHAQMRLGDGSDRTVTPWEQELVRAASYLPEVLRAQNLLLADPPKKRKGEEAEEALDDSLPSGALAKLYADALGYDALPRLCAALHLDLTRDDDVLELDAALAGLIGAYGLAQSRSEEVAKRAKRHADELESHRYTLTAMARPIHEKAEAIRNLRRNPTIPGVAMDPPPAPPPVPPPPPPPPVVPPMPPSAGEVAAALLDLMVKRAREKAGEVLDAAPAPAQLGDGRVPWTRLRVWNTDTKEEVGGIHKQILLALVRWLSSPEARDVELGGYCFLPLGYPADEVEYFHEPALIDDELIELPSPEGIDWTGFSPPDIRSELVRGDQDEATWRIPSHRCLTAEEISAVERGYPAEKIRGIFFADGWTEYTVDTEEHAAHREKVGLGSGEEEEKAPKKRRKKGGK